MPKKELISVHVFISGVVQGVGYRYATIHQARKLGLSGWVRNCRDGRVEAVFEGDRSTVELMIQWCHQGPPPALVKGVSVEINEPQGVQGFELKTHN
jgi:acylphosphatase